MFSICEFFSVHPDKPAEPEKRRLNFDQLPDQSAECQNEEEAATPQKKQRNNVVEGRIQNFFVVRDQCIK